MVVGCAALGGGAAELSGPASYFRGVPAVTGRLTRFQHSIGITGHGISLGLWNSEPIRWLSSRPLRPAAHHPRAPDRMVGDHLAHGRGIQLPGTAWSARIDGDQRSLLSTGGAGAHCGLPRAGNPVARHRFTSERTLR